MRKADEWDLRIDVHDIFTATTISRNLQRRLLLLKYAFIAGEETPDTPLDVEDEKKTLASGPRSDNIHIHLGIVLNKELTRDDVIRLVLNKEWNELPKSQVYARPRSKAYSYGGWIAHHTKEATKILPTDDNLFWEYGEPPMENLDEVSNFHLQRWVALINRYATPYWKERLSVYEKTLKSRFDEGQEGFIGPTVHEVEILPEL